MNKDGQDMQDGKPVSDAGVTRSDVPYILRPAAVSILTAIVVYIYAAHILPDSHTNLVEAFVGVAFGLAAGFVLSLVCLAYAREVSQECGEIPGLKLAYSLKPPQKPIFMACVSVFFLLWIFGMAGMDAALKALSDAPDAGLRNSLDSLVIFLLLTFLVPAWRAVRWYHRLPD